VIEESRQICGQLKLVADIIRTRAVPADLGKKDIEMTPEEVICDSCIVCLPPAYDIVERLIDVQQPEKGGTSQNNYDEPQGDASCPPIVQN